ncbi:hypothetical protein CYLTODRAFT_372187 [Cylindrobasidium torrendii FP15055 ss-10]|uniref:BTB domain-containing protein n=1 Tax=Cylindrobasidium torrendii FP15055 ss-10 TaxID=1314674 RepID=A0A0D7BHT8_9AGAR|nr:hypothetical protein CYLTODRAFT_372187 [Cylindrobasidium torrendii FP15055 ss-10]
MATPDLHPFSSSPGRASALSRPQWPWSPAPHNAAHRSNSSSLSTPIQGISPSPSWDSRRIISPSPGPSHLARHNTGSTMGYAPVVDESTRQWTFLGFEWIVRDLQKLRDHLEGEQPTTHNDDDFDILKQSPMMGDNKFKLEIARTHNEAADPRFLSLYITSLALDFAHSDYELSASMMAGIKCETHQRGARPDWVWEFWENDWSFRQESEVWACSLPSLSTLLDNPRIKETDSFVISVQIHTPLGPLFPSHPSAYYVPKDLLDGLEASLDNPNTGDVRFVCLERLSAGSVGSPRLEDSEEVVSPTSHAPLSPRATARKRIIYAHSDILTKRSDYFAAMLASSFAENQSSHSDRKLFTIVVEDADFETVYWLLKYCYANWLLFKENDDPRLAVEGIGAGWSARWLRTEGGEWDWKTFRKVNQTEDPHDGFSATSGESIHSRSSSAQGPHAPPRPSQPSTPAKASTLTTPSGGTARSASQATMSSSARRPAQVSAPAGSSSSNRPKPSAVPIPPAGQNFPATHYPVSPHAQRPRQAHSADPHVHPTPAPTPASALSMYQVAHRYGMPTLANLALDHMLATLTPHTGFALLLATSAWEEVHGLVENYVVDKWEEVNASAEFERCCQEVSAGEWGPEGGQTMLNLFRRLRSPSMLGYSRA